MVGRSRRRRVVLVLGMVAAFVAGQRVPGLADGVTLLAGVALRVRPVDGFDVVLNTCDVTACQPAQLAHAPPIRPAAHPAPDQRRVKKIWTKKITSIFSVLSLSQTFLLLLWGWGAGAGVGGFLKENRHTCDLPLLNFGPIFVISFTAEMNLEKRFKI